jgi:leader peptidase (prepilin peptidase) / N-methyltransferase
VHRNMFSPLLTIKLLAASVASLFGLLVGSFANVVIYRLPLEQSIVFPSSRCPKCLATIRPWQNIPVLSWCLLGGRCASCREPISARYPAVEALHGIGFALIVWRFGLWPFTLVLLLFFVALVVLAFIDWDHQILPDVITLPGIVIGVSSSFIPGALVDWKESALAAVFGYIAFFLVAEGYARLRGIEGLGQGDWKLAAMMGAFVGGQRLLLTVFLASLSGMIYGLTQAMRLRGESVPPVDSAPIADPASLPDPSPDPSDKAPSIGKYKLPFGTFLAASAIFVLFCGDSVLGWYASLFRF